jgi:hypothetical protein
MDTILIALAFVGGLTGMIIVGMIVTLYFYAHDALRLGHSRGVQSLRTFTARSVPVQVTTGAGQSEINLGSSSDPTARYVRGGLIVMACFILVIVIAFISVLSTSLH